MWISRVGDRDRLRVFYGVIGRFWSVLLEFYDRGGERWILSKNGSNR